MKRYSIDFYGDKMVEDKDGEYVKYDDAQKIREAYYGAWENAVVSGLLEIDLRDELEQQKYAFDNMQKLYLEIIVAANDNAEKLDAMTVLAEKYKGQRDELMEMIRIIPCSCHEGFKGRNLTDPDCPRCNWIDDDLITRIQDQDKRRNDELEAMMRKKIDEKTKLAEAVRVTA